jgi:hypothetical protein
MTVRSFLVLMITLVSTTAVSAYEWLSHNRMAFNGRDIFLGAQLSHQPPYPADADLLAFLAAFGNDIDTRAGNACDVNQDPTCPSTDEDHTEGLLTELAWCTYHERPCTSSLLASREPRQGNV